MLGNSQPAIRRALWRDFWDRPVSKIKSVWQGTRLYRWQLNGTHSDLIEFYPQWPFAGDADLADEMFTGNWVIGGHRLNLRGTIPWQSIVGDNIKAQQARQGLHGFGWLPHFTAAHDISDTGPGAPPTSAMRFTRELTENWVNQFGDKVDPVTWAPAITARRLVSWLTHLKLLIHQAEPVYRSRFLSTTWRQARHLSRQWAWLPEGADRITAAIGLILAGLVIAKNPRQVEQAMGLLEKELNRQILADGGHISGSPQIAAQVLADLACLYQVLIAADLPRPEPLMHTMDKMVPLLRLLTMPDGGLTQMNGGIEQGLGLPRDGDGTKKGKGSTASSMEQCCASPAQIIKATNVTARGLNAAPHTGYLRAEKNRTKLVIEGLSPQMLAATDNPASLYRTRPHCAPGAIELSAGRNRLIVNIGPPFGLENAWQAPLRSTPAHSNLIINGDPISDPVSADNPIYDVAGPAMLTPPKDVKLNRQEQDGMVMLSVQHDGWAASYGLLHERDIYMDAEGGDIRAEDRLIPAPGKQAEKRRAAIAAAIAAGEPAPMVEVLFHLHPSVATSITGAGGMVLLNPPSGPGWSFESPKATLLLEESVYAGAIRPFPEKPRGTKMIRLTTPLSPDGCQLRWRMGRFDKVKPKDPTDDLFGDDDA